MLHMIALYLAPFAFGSSLLTGDLDLMPPALGHLAERVVLITTETPNPRATAFEATSVCPDPDHDIPVGGDCHAGDEAILAGTHLVWGAHTASFTCRFRQAEGNRSPIGVSVLCIRNAR